MSNYVLARDVILKKGTRMVAPAPLPMSPVSYAHASLTPEKLDEDRREHLAFVSIPLEEAIRVGLIGEERYD